MNKIISVALATAAFAASSTAAFAANATAPAGVEFNVTAACTLTAARTNVGTFVAGQSGQKYVDRQGEWTISEGSDTNKTLATVNCPTGLAWNLAIRGTAAFNAVEIKDPSGALFSYAVPVANAINGTALASSATIFGNDANSVLNGTGSGAAQVVEGKWATFGATDSGMKTKTLVEGLYTGDATATLSW